jgi:cell division protein YceG involved in septum cleavage
MYQESFDLYLNYQLINRVFVNHLTLYVSSDFGKYYYHSYFKKTKILICQGNNDSFNLNEGRQKILVGQTFLSGKAINSEIIIDDIAVVDDKTDSSDFGKYYYHSYFKKTKILICYFNSCC